MFFRKKPAPAPKVPSDKAVIEALTKQYEEEKQKAFDRGYDWCAAEPDPEVFMKNLNNGKEINGDCALVEPPCWEDFSRELIRIK